MNINKDAARVLIYGDSITWGKIPNEAMRYDIDIRYTGVLQKELGVDYEVVEEGLRSRMAKGEHPYSPDRDGFKQFPAILASHLPIDILIIFLGINDTNDKSDKQPGQIVVDLESYLSVLERISISAEIKPPSKIVFVAPPQINKSFLKKETVFTGAQDKLGRLPGFIQTMAADNGVLCFDASKIISVSESDGVHLDSANNIKLGKALSKFIS